MDPSAPGSIERMLAGRAEAGEAFFAREAPRIARLCEAMATRFAAGGRLLAIASSAQERSDAHHVAVEFVHPVIVGKRALPALAVTGADEGLAAQVDLVARPGDMVIAFGEDGSGVAAALDLATRRGCLTVACSPAGASWCFEPGAADAFVRQELVETLYHVLWEHVHVFLDQQPVARGDAGAAGFLYPFLERGEATPPSDQLVGDVISSIHSKVAETQELRHQTLTENERVLADAAAAIARAAASGGTVFTLGNGGSATDAMDAAADLRRAAACPTIDLTADAAILTALANDIGPASIFARQLGALGRAGDVALAFSTSGDSENVVEALAAARANGLTTIALVGYGGGRIAGLALADHVVVTRSQYVPRIQEAQAAAYHALCELVDRGSGSSAQQ